MVQKAKMWVYGLGLTAVVVVILVCFVAVCAWVDFWAKVRGEEPQRLWEYDPYEYY